MSERLNSVDIEDVLSSIRRLVSEDARPGAKAAAPAAPAQPAPPPADLAPDPVEPVAVEPAPVGEAVAQEPAPVAEPVMPTFSSSRGGAGRRPVPVVDPQADKLILTPSLRIVPEPADAMPEAAEQPKADVEEVAEAPMVEDAEEEFGVDTAAAEEVAPFAPRADGGPARLDAVMDRVAQELDAAEQDWEPVGEAPQAFASDWEDEVAPDTAPVEAVEEAAAGAQPDDILPGHDLPQDPPVEAQAWDQPDWATPDWQAVESLPAEALGAPVSPAMAEEGAMTQKDDPADLPDWARMEADPVIEDAPFVAAAAAAGGAHAGAGDATGRAAPAGDARWADAAEAQIRRELEDEVGASAFAHFDDDDHDERRFDEEMLRDLVRDIIREELQGALGERITRNVRKLVRAEIARAMAVRDFE